MNSFSQDKSAPSFEPLINQTHKVALTDELSVESLLLQVSQLALNSSQEPSLNWSGQKPATATPTAPSQLSLLLFALLVLINLIVIFGNILVIVAVYASAKLRSVTNIFIVSLATADLLLGLLVLPYALLYEVLDVWIFGQLWCRGWLVTDVWISTASILNLCAISIDRYVAVTRPVKYRSIMTNRRARCIVAIVWLLSFIICFPPLLTEWRTVSGNNAPPTDTDKLFMPAPEPKPVRQFERHDLDLEAELLRGSKIQQQTSRFQRHIKAPNSPPTTSNGPQIKPETLTLSRPIQLIGSISTSNETIKSVLEPQSRPSHCCCCCCDTQQRPPQPPSSTAAKCISLSVAWACSRQNNLALPTSDEFVSFACSRSSSLARELALNWKARRKRLQSEAGGGDFQVLLPNCCLHLCNLLIETNETSAQFYALQLTWAQFVPNSSSIPDSKFNSDTKPLRNRDTVLCCRRRRRRQFNRAACCRKRKPRRPLPTTIIHCLGGLVEKGTKNTIFNGFQIKFPVGFVCCCSWSSSCFLGQLDDDKTSPSITKLRICQLISVEQNQSLSSSNRNADDVKHVEDVGLLSLFLPACGQHEPVVVSNRLKMRDCSCKHHLRQQQQQQQRLAVKRPTGHSLSQSNVIKKTRGISARENPFGIEERQDQKQSFSLQANGNKVFIVFCDVAPGEQLKDIRFVAPKAGFTKRAYHSNGSPLAPHSQPLATNGRSRSNWPTGSGSRFLEPLNGGQANDLLAQSDHKKCQKLETLKPVTGNQPETFEASRAVRDTQPIKRRRNKQDDLVKALQLNNAIEPPDKADGHYLAPASTSTVAISSGLANVPKDGHADVNRKVISSRAKWNWGRPTEFNGRWKANDRLAANDRVALMEPNQIGQIELSQVGVSVSGGGSSEWLDKAPASPLMGNGDNFGLTQMSGANFTLAGQTFGPNSQRQRRAPKLADQMSDTPQIGQSKWARQNNNDHDANLRSSGAELESTQKATTWLPDTSDDGRQQQQQQQQQQFRFEPTRRRALDQSEVCELFHDKTYVVYSSLGSFYIPMLVMVFFYSRIYLVASRAQKAMQRGYMTTKWPPMPTGAAFRLGTSNTNSTSANTTNAGATLSRDNSGSGGGGGGGSGRSRKLVRNVVAKWNQHTRQMLAAAADRANEPNSQLSNSISATMAASSDLKLAEGTNLTDINSAHANHLANGSASGAESFSGPHLTERVTLRIHRRTAPPAREENDELDDDYEDDEIVKADQDNVATHKAETEQQLGAKLQSANINQNTPTKDGNQGQPQDTQLGSCETIVSQMQRIPLALLSRRSKGKCSLRQSTTFKNQEPNLSQLTAIEQRQTIKPQTFEAPKLAADTQNDSYLSTDPENESKNEEGNNQEGDQASARQTESLLNSNEMTEDISANLNDDARQVSSNEVAEVHPTEISKCAESQNQIECQDRNGRRQHLHRCHKHHRRHRRHHHHNHNNNQRHNCHSHRHHHHHHQHNQHNQHHQNHRERRHHSSCCPHRLNGSSKRRLETVGGDLNEFREATKIKLEHELAAKSPNHLDESKSNQSDICVKRNRPNSSRPLLMASNISRGERSQSVDVTPVVNANKFQHQSIDRATPLEAHLNGSFDETIAIQNNRVPVLVVNWDPASNQAESLLSSDTCDLAAHNSTSDYNQNHQRTSSATDSKQHKSNRHEPQHLSYTGTGLSLVANIPQQVRKQSIMLLSSLTTRSSQTLRRISMVAAHPMDSLLKTSRPSKTRRRRRHRRQDQAGDNPIASTSSSPSESSSASSSSSDDNDDNQRCELENESNERNTTEAKTPDLVEAQQAKNQATKLIQKAAKRKAKRRRRKRATKTRSSANQQLAGACPKKTLDDYLMAVAGIDTSTDSSQSSRSASECGDLEANYNGRAEDEDEDEDEDEEDSGRDFDSDSLSVDRFDLERGGSSLASMLKREHLLIPAIKIVSPDEVITDERSHIDIDRELAQPLLIGYAEQQQQQQQVDKQPGQEQHISSRRNSINQSGQKMETKPSSIIVRNSRTSDEFKVKLTDRLPPSSGLHRQGGLYESATSQSRIVGQQRNHETSPTVCDSNAAPLSPDLFDLDRKRVTTARGVARAAATSGPTTKPRAAQVNRRGQPASGASRRRGVATGSATKRTSRWHAKRLRAETKAAKTVAIIVGGFIFCWLPFFTAYLTRAVICSSYDCIPQTWLSLFIWLGYLNSALNPLIYGLFSADFRHAFKNIVCRCRFVSDLRRRQQHQQQHQQNYQPQTRQSQPSNQRTRNNETSTVSLLVDSIIKSIL